MSAASARNKLAFIASVALLAATIAALVLALEDSSAQAKLSKSANVSAAPNGDLRFNTKKITVAHGKVTLTMTNPSGLRHAIAIEGHGVEKKGKGAEKGGTSKVSASLKKGTYTFYCPIFGHEEAGMKGKLVVK